MATVLSEPNGGSVKSHPTAAIRTMARLGLLPSCFKSHSEKEAENGRVQNPRHHTKIICLPAVAVDLKVAAAEQAVSALALFAPQHPISR